LKRGVASIASRALSTAALYASQASFNVGDSVSTVFISSFCDGDDANGVFAVNKKPDAARAEAIAVLRVITWLFLFGIR
jgi:hypothetical protein